MTQLVFTAAGRVFDSNTMQDLTETAHQYLFCDLALGLEGDAPVTPRAVLTFLQNSPVLRQVYARWLPDEMLLEALGPEPSYSLEGGIDPADIEYLELYRSFDFDSREDVFQGLHSLMLHGVGFVHQEDVQDHGMVLYKAGSRTYYGLDLTACRKVLDLPVQLCTEVSVLEADQLDRRWGTRVSQYRVEELQLGEFLQAMLEELSYYGEPTEEAAESNND